MSDFLFTIVSFAPESKINSNLFPKFSPFERKLEITPPSSSGTALVTKEEGRAWVSFLSPPTVQALYLRYKQVWAPFFTSDVSDVILKAIPKKPTVFQPTTLYFFFSLLKCFILSQKFFF